MINAGRIDDPFFLGSFDTGGVPAETFDGPLLRRFRRVGARRAIEEDRFAEYCAEKYAGWAAPEPG